MTRRIFLIMLLIASATFNLGCIQEKLVEKPTLNPGPAQFERWTYTLRAPVGTWKYRIALNPRLINNAWTAKEVEVTSTSDPLMSANTFVIDPSLTAPANTGEVIQYGTRDFRFYSSDSLVTGQLQGDEDLDSANLLIEPDNFKMGKYWFTNQMVVRFYYYANHWETPGNETVVALVGTFNNWGKGGERSRQELKDDGVFPDATANDGIWTIEIPLESTFTYKYKFLVDAQWDAAAGEWKSDTGIFVPDYANPNNTRERWKGDSYLTVN